MTVAIRDDVVDLCVPPDWAELLLPDDRDAGAYFDQLVRQSWPTGPVELWTGGAAVLMAWREAMLARGAVSHGVISATQPDGTPARWQVLTSVVDLPPEPEIDVPTLLGDLVRAQESEIHYIETYETDMGLGVGLIGQREVRAPAGLTDLESRGVDVVGEPLRVGVAAALSCEPGAARGVLVVGVSLAQEQVLEMAALVAVIAGRSWLRPASPTIVEEGPRG